jgi:hypothetical protein
MRLATPKRLTISMKLPRHPLFCDLERRRKRKSYFSRPQSEKRPETGNHISVFLGAITLLDSTLRSYTVSRRTLSRAPSAPIGNNQSIIGPDDRIRRDHPLSVTIRSESLKATDPVTHYHHLQTQASRRRTPSSSTPVRRSAVGESVSCSPGPRPTKDCFQNDRRCNTLPIT